MNGLRTAAQSLAADPGQQPDQAAAILSKRTEIARFSRGGRPAHSLPSLPATGHVTSND
jgi:hypothetical protein